jgi:hypothetical protein
MAKARREVLGYSSGMRAARPWLGICAAAVVLAAPRLFAAEPWLTVSGSHACPSDSAELAPRIERQIAGAHNSELRVDVELRDEGRNTKARIRLFQRSESTSKTLLAADCDEALEAVATVVALALSSESEETPEGDEPVSAPESALRDESTPKAASAAAEAARDRGVTRGPAPRSALLWQVHGAAGLDVGTLAEPTAIVGAGLSAASGPAEMRATAWYGLPSSREEASGTFERTRGEFAAVAADYCRGLDRERWLRVCAGVEGRLAWLAHLEVASDNARRDRSRVVPGMGASAGAAFVYRSAALRPELAISAQMPVLGAADRAETPIFRALLGGELSL